MVIKFDQVIDDIQIADYNNRKIVLSTKRGEPIRFQIPKLYMPFGISGFTPEIGNKKWNIDFSMRGFDEKNRILRPVPSGALHYVGHHVDHEIVENIEPDFAPDLETRAVLGGRVWEVYGAKFAPPISATVDANGGRVEFKTGSFWMKQDGAWSVFEK